MHENFVSGKGTFATVYTCRKQYSRRKYAAKIVEYRDDKKIKWETENEIEVCYSLVLPGKLSEWRSRLKILRR